MKYMQKQGLKILCTMLLTVSTIQNSSAQVFDYRLRMADSLFMKKQYTQSLELYQEIFHGRSYTPAMLLKMAFIEEGLGKKGTSLYYLSLYHQLTRSEPVLRKMEETAEKYKLEGYEFTGQDKMLEWLSRYRQKMVTGLMAGSFLMFVWLFLARRKNIPYVPLTFLGLFLGATALCVNFDWEGRLGIIHNSPAYLMSGPSPGSSVIAIIGEGHRLTIKGKEDVWILVKWMDGYAYVKENQLLEIEL